MDPYRYRWVMVKWLQIDTGSIGIDDFILILMEPFWLQCHEMLRGEIHLISPEVSLFLILQPFLLHLVLCNERVLSVRHTN